MFYNIRGSLYTDLYFGEVRLYDTFASEDDLTFGS